MLAFCLLSSLWNQRSYPEAPVQVPVIGNQNVSDENQKEIISRRVVTKMAWPEERSSLQDTAGSWTGFFLGPGFLCSPAKTVAWKSQAAQAAVCSPVSLCCLQASFLLVHVKQLRVLATALVDFGMDKVDI